MALDAVLARAESTAVQSASPDGAADTHPVPDHAVRLSGSGWNLWRSFVLRGTGFPVTTVAALAAAEASAAADGYLRASADVQRCLDVVMQALKQAIDAADSIARGPLRDRRHDVLRGRLPPPRTEDEEALARAWERRAAARTEYVAAFDRAGDVLRGRLKELVAEPRFREAALWQNHSSLQRVVHGLDDSRPHRRRRATEFVAMLAQRYALKNESIGFFGPVVWAALADGATATEIEPGPALLNRRGTYFENWCLEALAAEFDKDPEIRRWMPPRLRTGVWMGARHVHVPMMGVVAVTGDERRLLDLCDGVRSAHDIARTIVGAASSSLSSDDAVYDVLQELVRRQVLTWRVEIAPQLHPERELEATIARIGDSARRAQCAAALGELVAARDAIAAAAGRPDDLIAALERLDETFSRLTGAEPSRRHGETYAGRALVYEDCRRDCRVTIGGRVLERLGPPLSLMLDSARWVAAHLGQIFSAHMRRCHAELRGRNGPPEVDGHSFFRYVWSTPPAKLATMSDQARQKYQVLWQSILGADLDARRVTRSVDEIADAVRTAFGAPAPLWSRARYFSPDLMIAAAGPDALRRGEFYGVLGEVHSTNSLLWSGIGKQCPDLAALTAQMADDAGDDLIMSVQVQKEIWLARTAAYVVAPTTWQYQFGDMPPGEPVHRPAPSGKFIAVDTGAGVVMRARDGSLEFDALELFGMPLCVEANTIINHYFPRAAHTPRVTIGDLTIARERWYVQPRTMSFLEQEDRAEQFAAMRAWARERGMPRRLFYKSPLERKPCHLDLDSPVYVEIFIKAMRPLEPDARVRLEEMVPDVDETWLVDANGARYTSELRIAAFRADPRERSGAASGTRP